MKATVSIIILSWNTREHLYRCLRSHGERLHSGLFEVIVVDNASVDGSVQMVRESFPSVRLIVNHENMGYAAGNNLGIRESSGEYILLLNSDVEIINGAVEIMCDFLKENTSYGAVAAQLLSPDGSVQESCKRFPTLVSLFLFDLNRNRLLRKTPPVRRYFMRDFDHLGSGDVEQPPGACFMIPRRVVQEVGVFDERFFLFFNDVDYCRRIVQKGYRIRYLSEARVIHHGSRSVSNYDAAVNEWYVGRYRYFAKWYGRAGGLLAKLAVGIVTGEECIRILLRRLLSAGSARKGTMSKELRELWNRVQSVWKDSWHG